MLPSKVDLFDALSYFSILYFFCDYVWPKACALVHRIGLSLMCGMEFGFAFKRRWEQLRSEAPGAPEPDASP